MNVAQNQANWLAGGNNTGHLGPDGRLPHERARAAGYGGGEDSFAVENVAQGTMELHTPELVVKMWQGDYGHLTAMISPKYEHIGVGYAVETDMSWFVMVVGWTGSEGVAGGSAENTNPTVVVPEDPPSVITQVINTPDPGASIYHEVQPGNTIWKISEDYGINIWQLLEQNDLTYESIIQPGDLILIQPPSTPTETPEPTLLPTVTQTQIITLQVLSQTEDAKVPDETSIPWTSVELKAPFPRSTLLIIFLVIGCGLLILAALTILSNGKVF
jgi:LysM repeat protein